MSTQGETEAIMDELAKLREALNLFRDPPLIEGTFTLVRETQEPLSWA